jgi:hypothetical protein
MNTQVVHLIAAHRRLAVRVGTSPPAPVRLAPKTRYRKIAVFF